MRALDPAITEIAAGALEYNRGFIGGLFVQPFPDPNESCFLKGHVDVFHAHYIDHARLLVSGSVLLECLLLDGIKCTVVVHGPAFIPIPAGVEHKTTVLEDGTRWWCIFAQAEAEAFLESDKNSETPIPFDAANWSERAYVCK